MFTIWFNLHNGSKAHCIEVEGLQTARDVWDRLAKEFFMRTARP